MNDCPRRYIQKKAAYRSVSPLHKTRFGGFLLLQGGRMNDCPRRYVQKKAAYRSVSSLHKKLTLPKNSMFFITVVAVK
ncbi:hypothetical protein, partial [Salmonella enterica]|uniref:hypothetical protein n=1 Tax=Salmonella enterica TaxID=28901 RepID=UPI001F2DD0A6